MVTERRAVGRNPYWLQIAREEIAYGPLSRTQIRFSLHRGLGPVTIRHDSTNNSPAMESSWQRPIQLV